MKNNFIIKNYLGNHHIKKNSIKNVARSVNQIFRDISRELDEPNKIYNILSNNYDLTFSIKDLHKFRKFNTIAIIGMGGSILGTEAIYHSLIKKIKKKVYFFDDINNDKIKTFKKFNNLKHTLFIVISKSGNTIETISNFLSLNKIVKNQKNVIIISEKKNNSLYSLAKKFNLFFIEHKNYIGGRYSVLSEVGLVPAYILGINIKKLRKNLTNYLLKKNNKIVQDSSIKLANILNRKKFNNLIFLNYSPRLEKFLFWSQQLLAESLGKKNKGFLPVVSNVPKDHHSLLQLYLDGPKDKLFYIFSIEEKYDLKIKTNNLSKKIKYLNNKSLHKIKSAQKNALIHVFKKKKYHLEFLH